MKIFIGLFIFFFTHYSLAAIIHEEQSLYRNIIVTEKKQKRCMTFSLRDERKQNQSCKLMNKPNFLVFDYAKLTIGGILATEQPKNILIIGLGGGTLVEAFHKLAPQANITSVEVDSAVIKVAKSYFSLPSANWHNVVEKDGRIFIKREILKKHFYDVVVLDAFNGDYIPEHLMTLEFFKEVKSILSKNGIVLANTFSTSKLKDYESATYHAAFGNLYQFEGTHSGNRVIIASNSRLPTISKMKQRSAIYHEHFKNMGIDLEYLWESLNTTPRINTKYKILTDDYAPVNILKD